MMPLIALVAASFAAGGIVIAFLFGAIYLLMCAKKNSPSEYYFDVPRKPTLPKLENILDNALYGLSFCLLGMIFSLFSFLHFFNNTNGLCVVRGIVEFLQDGINVLVPMMFTAILIFSSFRKPHYILFTTNDVVRRYKINLYAFLSVVTWVICFGIMLMDKVVATFTEDALRLLAHSILLSFQLACILLCSLALVNSCRIIFSSKPFELQILDVLYYRISDSNSYLQRIDKGDVSNLDIIRTYLIDQLSQKANKAENQLKKYMKLSSVEFWDAINEAPQSKEKQVLFPICFLSAYSFSMGFGIILILSALPEIGKLFDFWKQNLPFIVSFSVITLYLLAHLLVSYPPLCQMRRAVLYGRWGYRFLDKQNCPQRYIPRYPLRANRTVKWFRALLNVLTLCRIECVNGCSDELLQKLSDTLSEFQDHKCEEPQAFIFALAYYLCLKLAEEIDPADISIQNAIAEVLHKTSQKDLLISWAKAIWVDMKRDMDWYRQHQEK